MVHERLLAKLSGAHNFRLALVDLLRVMENNAHFTNGPPVKTILAGTPSTGAITSRSVLTSYLIAANSKPRMDTASPVKVMGAKRRYASLSSLFLSAVYRTG